MTSVAVVTPRAISVVTREEPNVKSGRSNAG